MCDCIKNHEKNIVENGEYEGKKIISASIGNVVFPMDQLKITGKITTSPLEINIEGRKTKIKTSLQHTYCPWCGEAYRSKEHKVPLETSKS